MRTAKGAEAPESGEGAPARKGTSKLLLGLIVGVVLLGGLGGAAWFLAPRLLRSTGDHGGTGTAASPAGEPKIEVKTTVPLGPVIVNLAGEERRYAKVAVDVGVPSEHDAKEVEEHKAQLRDLVISMISGLELEELISPEGREELKEELLSRIHDEIHLEKVGGVYFTEFVIQ